MHAVPSKLLLIATAVAAAAALVVGSSFAAPAAQPSVKRFTFIERELASPTLDLGKHGFSALDRQTITSDILDLHGHVVGRLDDDCGVTAVGKRGGAICSAVMTFRDGQLVGTRFASFGPGKPSPQPITGGSGAYLGARGEVRVVKKTKLGLEFVIELVS